METITDSICKHCGVKIAVKVRKNGNGLWLVKRGYSYCVLHGGKALSHKMIAQGIAERQYV